MAAVDNEQQSAGPEAPLEPELPICDPHHHLWERPDNPYLPADFLRDVSSGHNIVATVAVECRAWYRRTGSEELKPVGETEFLDEVSAKGEQEKDRTTALAAGIVGYADLMLGESVVPVLEAHLDASPARLRGIRCSTQWDGTGAARSVERSGILREPSFRKGVLCVGRAGLSFDAWLYHPQIPELADLAHSLPDVAIILDHIGGPLGVGPYSRKRDAVFQQWRGDIADLAACENVSVKLGGVGSLRSGHDWHERAVKPGSEELADAMRPYFEVCIEQFGVERCMFESNFPVDKVSYSYVSIWNAFKRMTRGYSVSERTALFHDTASRIYRLP